MSEAFCDFNSTRGVWNCLRSGERPVDEQVLGGSERSLRVIATDCTYGAAPWQRAEDFDSYLGRRELMYLLRTRSQ